MRDVAVESSFDGTTALLVVSGEIAVDTADAVRASIHRLLSRRPIPRFALDLAHVTFVDSYGLRLLVEAQRTVMALGGELVVRDPSSMVERLLRMTALDELFVVEHVGADGVADTPRASGDA